MRSERILITGLSSTLGGRLAQELEQDRAVEAIVGIDTEDPRHELDRTEFVRVEIEETLLRRILRAAAIDTVIDTRLSSDPLAARARRTDEAGVFGTRNLLAACRDTRVRRLVFQSSEHYYGCEHDDPAFFSEDMTRSRPPGGSVELDVVEAEAAVAEFGAANPETSVTVLRCAETIGAEVRGAATTLLGLPVVPSILGFDPRWQFVHQEDVIGALAHAARHDLPGAYNVAADGVLALSEIAALLGKPMLPVLPPWGTVFAGAQLRRLGLPVPVEMLRRLRFGRGLDNRRLKATGYAYRYTTREAVLKLRAEQRLRPLLGSGSESYRYEREVEEFLRWSPSVQSARAAREAGGGPGDSGPGDGSPGDGGPGHSGRSTAPIDDLGEAELIDLISSLELDALRRLHAHESANARREAILAALDHNLERFQSREEG